MSVNLSQSLPIITITLNPAIDLNGGIPSLAFNQVNRIQTAVFTAGGKGIIVAAVIAALGGCVTTMGWLGKNNESAFTDYFQKEGIIDKFTRVAGDTRTNIKIVESSQQVTELNFPSFTVGPAQIEELLTQIESIQSPAIVVLAGSLPAGVAPSFYAQLITMLNKKGHKVCFDSSGNAFARGVESAPYLIKPNIHELSEWAGRPLITFVDKKSVAQQLLALGIEHVLLSEGEAGLLYFSAQGAIQAIPPKVVVSSTVGAGDSLLGAFIWAVLNQYSEVEAVKFAVAVSALSVTQIGGANIDLAKLQAMQAKVVVDKY